MLQIKKGCSTHSDAKLAALEVVRQIEQSESQLILFFVSYTYDFKIVHQIFHEQFPHVTLAGCVSQGEIGTSSGYGENSICAVSIACDDFKLSAVLCKDVSKQSMLYKEIVTHKMKEVGLDPSDHLLYKKGFCLTLIDGLRQTEEKVMMLFDYILQGNPLSLVGGSAGELAKQESSFIALNGEVTMDAALLLFVRTDKPFTVYKENIYAPLNETYRVTHASLRNRIVYELDNQPAISVFAKALHLAPNQINSSTFSVHPLGRIKGDDVYITSPYVPLENGGIQCYSQVANGSTVHLMHQLDTKVVAKQTAGYIAKTLTRPKLILGFNCISRYMQFKNEGSTKVLYDTLNAVAPFTGFTTLGEQYGTEHINQTLTLLALGE